MTDYTQVIDFWFEEIARELWFNSGPEFDQQIRSRFGALHLQAEVGELSAWRTSALGRLAEIIVLDQFSRNIYRDTPRAFASDTIALVLAQEAVACQADQSLGDDQKAFLYMPFMHSESLLIHETAMQLFSASGLQHNLEFEIRHKAIIERFGRYPHRNVILGRESTPQELEFLQQPGSRF